MGESRRGHICMYVFSFYLHLHSRQFKVPLSPASIYLLHWIVATFCLLFFLPPFSTFIQTLEAFKWNYNLLLFLSLRLDFYLHSLALLVFCSISEIVMESRREKIFLFISKTGIQRIECLHPYGCRDFLDELLFLLVSCIRLGFRRIKNTILEAYG